MKKIVNVTEVTGEGLVALLGENVLIMCLNYHYSGKLVGVNDTDVILEDPMIVYETGEWTAAKWKDAQKLGPKQWYLRIDKIESYGVGK